MMADPISGLKKSQERLAPHKIIVHCIGSNVFTGLPDSRCEATSMTLSPAIADAKHLYLTSIEAIEKQ
jgi:hypothetical protein